MSYYHYTKGSHLPNIVKDGIIKTTSVNCEKNEKPAVWLTKSPEWEVACNIGRVNNHEEIEIGKSYSSDEIDLGTVNIAYMRKEIGMCRLLIKETLPVISWSKFKYESGVTDIWYDLLNNYSRNTGSSVDEWLCSFNPIPKEYWEGIEMFVDDQWIRWDEKISVLKFIDICLSCNGNEYINKLPSDENVLQQYQNEADFLNKYHLEIAKFWRANMHKKGYVQIYVKPNYEPYDSGFKFIEKRVKKPTFTIEKRSPTNTYALVHILWAATFTQYRFSLPYDDRMY